jgi:hypothetical protein
MNRAVRPGIQAKGVSVLIVVVVLVLAGFVFVWRSLAVESILGPATPSVPEPALSPAPADPSPRQPSNEEGVVTLSYFTSRAVALLPYFKLAAVITLAVVVGLVSIIWLLGLSRRLFYAAKSRVGASGEPLPPLLTYPQGHSLASSVPASPAPTPPVANPPSTQPPALSAPAGTTSVLAVVVAVCAAVGLTTYYAGKAAPDSPRPDQLCPPGQELGLVPGQSATKPVCLPTRDQS